MKWLSQGCRAGNGGSRVPPSQACALVELHCFWPIESLNSTEVICSSMENYLAGKSQVQIVELWHSLEICLITFSYIFFSGNTWLQQCFHYMQFYWKRTESLFWHEAFFVFSWLPKTRLLYSLVSMDLKPSKTLASCTIFLDWFWSTFIASLVSNIGDFVSS